MTAQKARSEVGATRLYPFVSQLLTSQEGFHSAHLFRANILRVFSVRVYGTLGTHFKFPDAHLCFPPFSLLLFHPILG